MFKKKLLCILLVSAMFFATGCGTHDEPVENDVVEIVSAEAALASSALQYPATNDLFYYNVYDDYIAITKYIGDETFKEGEDGLSAPTVVKIPDIIDGLPVYVIGDNAFASATLEKVEISNNVISIGASAFENCKNLKEVIFTTVHETCEGRETANGVRMIGASAFKDCLALSSIVVPDSLEEIGSYAFYGCVSLKKINFPHMIVSIPDNVCFNCNSLEEIYISDSVSEIQNSAFENVAKNAQIYGGVYSQAAHYAADHFMLFVINRDSPDHVAAE